MQRLLKELFHCEFRCWNLLYSKFIRYELLECDFCTIGTLRLRTFQCEPASSQTSARATFLFAILCEFLEYELCPLLFITNPAVTNLIPYEPLSDSNLCIRTFAYGLFSYEACAHELLSCYSSVEFLQPQEGLWA